jgi:type II secretory pathway pseudopilin PulG
MIDRFTSCRLFRKKGVALPDLLAAVALIFIIGSLLIPAINKAVAQANISRAKRDLARMSQALDVYKVDHGAYPPSVDKPWLTPIPPDIYGAPHFAPPKTSHRLALIPLTTPLAYLDNVGFDAPFSAKAWEILEAEGKADARSYWYCNYGDFWRTSRRNAAPIPLAGYLLLAFGPNARGVEGISSVYPDYLSVSSIARCFARPNRNHVFDPTNGLYSRGNILRFGGKLALEEGVSYIP